MNIYSVFVRILIFNGRSTDVKSYLVHPEQLNFSNYNAIVCPLRWRYDLQHLLQREAKLGTKKPQLPQQHPHVVACSAHHRMQRIAQRTFERVSTQFAVHLHVPNGWLDGTAPLDHRLHGSCHPALA